MTDPARARARRARRLRLGTLALAAALALAAVVLPAPSADAQGYVRISGAGSTWSQNALDQWRRNVTSLYGMTVDYAGTGSSDGRRQFIQGTVDFAVSEIPFVHTPQDGSPAERPTRGYAYMPIVAGGTAFMYHLKIGGQRVTNLRLSGETIAKIFTGVITNWSDPAIAADNPALRLPNQAITPVVRSDGSGTTAQFTTWMAHQQPGLWNDYCGRVGKPTPCPFTSYYPTLPHMKAQSGSLGVAGYVQQGYGEGAITYVEYSYALKSGFPVAKVLNASGHYVEPTASNVAVGLLGARINDDAGSADYLTQILDGVYGNADPRAYPLSSYSYMILPTEVGGSFNETKGRTLGAFGYYFLCEGQQQAEVLGYSPLPINLVQAGMAQVRRIPGVQAQDIDIASCNNPTFTSSGQNRLVEIAPQPEACDRRGANQCTTGTAGAPDETPPSAGGGGGGGGEAGPGAGGDPGGPAGAGPAGPSGPAGSAGDDPTGPTGPSGPAGDGTGAEEVAVVDGDGAPVYDPDTGELLLASSSGGGSGGGGAQVVAGSQLVGAEPGWSRAQSLMLVAAAALVAVVVGPPLLSRTLARRER